jgi:hypothetical protein
MSPGPFGKIRTALALQSADSAAPPVGGPVAALGKYDQRSVAVQAASQPPDLLIEDALAGLPPLDPHVQQPVPTMSTLGSSCRVAFITTRGRRW